MSVQPSLFEDTRFAPTPLTEGVKFAGSKLKLIPYILEMAQRVNARRILDGFSGTTRVSQAFARRGYDVVCNDRAVWSEVFGCCYLLSHKKVSHYQSLINHLNDVQPRSAWFTEHYGGDVGTPSSGRAAKRPWQNHNTRKLDGIREEIDSLHLDADDRAVALSSLILALDEVDSTLGHFASYLREWSPRSFKQMRLKVPAIVQPPSSHEVLNKDIFEVAPVVDVDLAYYDPPYGSNNEKMPPSRIRYASYYHVWTTVCLNDQPRLFGRVNRRADTSDTIATSPFEEFRRNEDGRFIAVEAIHRLLLQSKAKYIILSYNSGGRATSEELARVIRASGELIDVVEVNYRKNVMAAMKWTSEWLRDVEEPNREFLFLIGR